MYSFLKKQWVGFLILLLPTVVFAANSAMLTVSGDEATLNGNDAPRSAALFVGDTVATTPDSIANINAEGSMVLVLADSAVRFEGNSLSMGHGGVVVTTSKAMAVRAGRLTIAPVAQRSAKFEVSESGGLVEIAARQGALAINDGGNTTILQEGQETSRPDSQADRKDKGAAPTGKGYHVSKKKLAYILIGTGAAGGTTAAILLATGGGGARPTSPAKP